MLEHIQVLADLAELALTDMKEVLTDVLTAINTNPFIAAVPIVDMALSMILNVTADIEHFAAFYSTATAAAGQVSWSEQVLSDVTSAVTLINAVQSSDALGGLRAVSATLTTHTQTLGSALDAVLLLLTVAALAPDVGTISAKTCKRVVMR